MVDTHKPRTHRRARARGGGPTYDSGPDPPRGAPGGGGRGHPARGARARAGCGVSLYP